MGRESHITSRPRRGEPEYCGTGDTLFGVIPPEARLIGETLNQALPYIQRFAGETFVIKYGGAAMARPETMEAVLRNVLLLQHVGIRVVVVHGGGPEIDNWLARLGIERRFENGQRVTDEETMDVVEMALAGRANKALVAEISRVGGRAVGLSGRDAGILTARPVSEELGRTGEIVSVNPSLVASLSAQGYVPVLCSVAGDDEARALNVNADLAAAAVAGALGAAKLVMLSDTPGVLRDRHDPGSRISRLGGDEARALIADGTIAGGMIPKVKSALRALELGVRRVHLIDGGPPNAILVELVTEAGIGTMHAR